MSGEAVVLVGVSLGSAGLALVAGAAALVAARLVDEWMREQHAQAQRNMRREKEDAEAWHSFHRSEQRELEKTTRRREALRRELEGLRLAGPETTVEPEAGTRAQGFVQRQSAELSAMLQSLIERIPDHFGAEAAAPLQRLQRQARELDAQLGSAAPPPQETVRTFQATVQRTLERILDDVEREQVFRGRLLERVEKLLGEVIACRHLSREEASSEELSQLQAHLMRLLTTRELSVAGVELLEAGLQGLKKEVDRQLEEAAVQAALEQRVRHHLQALGYRLGSTPDETAVWEIPGGERVRVSLQPGNRLAFQLVHERSVESDQPLSRDELAFLRRQEQRWCGDLHGLLRHLQEDGFEFQVQLERETPEDAIPLVVVEDVDEWFEREDVHEAPRKRHL